VPSLTTFIRTNRIAAQTNTVVGALNYARAESTTRGLPVSICAANVDRTACDINATDWANGWLTFTDRTGTVGTFDGTDELLQTSEAPEAGFALTTTASFVRFGVGTSPATDRTFRISPTQTGVCASTGVRLITVGLTGRINSSKSTC
jgi:type IV fimbrial biogenesis protein FimT